MPLRQTLRPLALMTPALAPGMALAQAIGQPVGAGLASIGLAEILTSARNDSIAPPTLQNPGSAFGMSDTSVRRSAGSTRAVVEVSDGRQVTYTTNTLVTAINGSNSASATLRPAGVPTPTFNGASSVIWRSSRSEAPITLRGF